MVTFEFILTLLFLAAIAVAFAPILKIPVEVLLLIITLFASMIPGLPPMIIDPDNVFYLLLPPILFAAAYFTSWRDFRRNIGPIARLSIGLVIFTVCGIGLLVHYFFPDIPLGVAFLLGAIVSPPDASAATVIGKKLGLQRRLLTIIEGESLINDATALVCYRLALGAVLSGTFSFRDAALSFVAVASGGALCGLAVGNFFLFLIRHLRNTTAESLLSLVTSFAAYLIAERLHVSGVVSTVVAGLAFGRSIPRVVTPETRIEATGAWNVTLLAINGLVFALIGLQLPHVLHGLQGYGAGEVLVVSLVVIGVLIGLRFMWVFTSYELNEYFHRGSSDQEEAPTWRTLVVLSWTGMRGIVSLAAALAIPLTVPGGAEFPHRALIVFLTYAVILFTLIVPTLTLPFLVRLLHVESANGDRREEIEARLSMARAAREHIGELTRNGTYDSRILNEFSDRYERFTRRMEPNLADSAFSGLDTTEHQTRLLLLELLEHERARLHHMRAKGEFHDSVFRQLSDELDLEELKIRRNIRP